jgi:hypothetical protein
MSVRLTVNFLGDQTLGALALAASKNSTPILNGQNPTIWVSCIRLVAAVHLLSVDAIPRSNPLVGARSLALGDVLVVVTGCVVQISEPNVDRTLRAIREDLP